MSVLKNKTISILKDIYSVIMLSICAIYRPWVDLYQSLKHQANGSFLFHRKTYQNFLTENLKKIEPCIRLYWHLLYGSSFIIAKLINIIVFYPFRFFATINTNNFKSTAYKNIDNDIDDRILKRPTMIHQRTSKLFITIKTMPETFNEKEINDEISNAFTNYFKVPLSSSKKALNQFRINPIDSYKP
ncbi:MAG: hypothetical protein P8L77_02660 [Gammaproteobacteria bacterium]|nr:hypothetical protein [Gammaproteobacteria bacterium]